jgi:hypothetical protein
MTFTPILRQIAGYAAVIGGASRARTDGLLNAIPLNEFSIPS